MQMYGLAICQHGHVGKTLTIVKRMDRGLLRETCLRRSSKLVPSLRKIQRITVKSTCSERHVQMLECTRPVTCEILQMMVGQELMERISMKMILAPPLPEGYTTLASYVNSFLPPSIRMWGFVRTMKSFAART